MIRIFLFIGFFLSLNVNAQNQLGFERVHTETVQVVVPGCSGSYCSNTLDSLAFYIVPQDKVLKINNIYSQEIHPNNSSNCAYEEKFVLNGLEMLNEYAIGMWLKAGDFFYFNVSNAGYANGSVCSSIYFDGIISFTEYSIISD